jgi:hypothetical protein
VVRELKIEEAIDILVSSQFPFSETSPEALIYRETLKEVFKDYETIRTSD